MSDLIYRLRNDFDDTDVQLEAADEIERLNSNIASLDIVITDQGAGILTLNKRIAKLKGALTSIVGQTDDQFVDGVWREVNTTARDALEKAE